MCREAKWGWGGPGAAQPHVPGTLGSRRWAPVGAWGSGLHPCCTHTSAPQVGAFGGVWQDTGSQVSCSGSSQRSPCYLLASRASLPSTSMSSALWCHLRSPRPAPPPGCSLIPRPANPSPPSAPCWQLRAPTHALVFLSLASLSSPSPLAHTLCLFQGLVLSPGRLSRSTELPQSGTHRFKSLSTTSVGFRVLSC